MEKQLTRKTLEAILQSQNIETLSPEQLRQFFLEEKDIAKFAPDGVCQIDPRNGDRIVYNSARARRPHDNRPAESEAALIEIEKECLICQGKTTGVVDVADLSEGFTFINKNLFPIFYPASKDGEKQKNNCDPVHGFHFLQWTSSYHNKDWHNMPQADRIIAMQRLAALENKLLSGSSEFVSIIKNYGHLVGGSLVHGHQQIGASNIIPNRYYENKQFQEEQEETFTVHMLYETPPELVIRDYGPAVLITPYFMRRPFDMQLIVKDTTKSHLHQLNEKEIAAVSDGWRDAIRVMLALLPQIGREQAYNVTTHNGPGAGLYFEFLPYTQEMGGFEHLGLYLCQGNPHASAAYAQEFLAHDSEGQA
jgi:galactose-1-phosphate uridylyltransferase